MRPTTVKASATNDHDAAPIALVTGGSAGLGLALVRALADRGWQVVTDGRSQARFKEADLPGSVTVVVGDVTDPCHRTDLVTAVGDLGHLDLLVHNASTLGPLPMRSVAAAGDRDLTDVIATNVAAPLQLTAALLRRLRDGDGVVLSISSDAAVQHYPTWGLYGASKAALDHLTLTFAAEEGVTAYAVDPGDMRTQMHQDAFPGEDISDRPEPATVVPALLRLLAERPRSGRYRAGQV